MIPSSWLQEESSIEGTSDIRQLITVSHIKTPLFDIQFNQLDIGETRINLFKDKDYYVQMLFDDWAKSSVNSIAAQIWIIHNSIHTSEQIGRGEVHYLTSNYFDKDNELKKEFVKNEEPRAKIYAENAYALLQAHQAQLKALVTEQKRLIPNSRKISYVYATADQCRIVGNITYYNAATKSFQSTSVIPGFITDPNLAIMFKAMVHPQRRAAIISAQAATNINSQIAAMSKMSADELRQQIRI